MKPVSWGLKKFIGVYQRYISPLFPPRCRYYPTCSAYAAEAIELHGAFKGVGLGVWRVLRCNPWSGGGIDYVPGHKEDEVDRIMKQMALEESAAITSGRKEI